MLDFNEPVIIHVPRKSLHAVPGNLVLEVNIADRRTDFMRMEVPMRRDVLKLEAHVGRHVVQRLNLMVKVRVTFLSCIDK